MYYDADTGFRNPALLRTILYSMCYKSTAVLLE